MKKFFLTIAALALFTTAFAQVETSTTDAEENEAFVNSHLYKLDEFSRGTVVFDQDAALYEDDGTPITLHPSQGIINVNNLHQCVVMIHDNDTIPLLYEEHVVKVNTGKNMYLKIKGFYYQVVEYNETVLGVLETLKAIDMGTKDIYGTNSQLSSVTNITSLAGTGGAAMETLRPNFDVRYTYEKRPVFIHGKKVAYLNEKQLCKMYKKKSAIVKDYFANHNVDEYSLEQAQELYKMLIK
ncbi:MAG: hypothetical protein J5693_05380 [Bacteroidales bacterium]|nr:hypothetical protein [Bacteroidales bacterium]